MLSSQYGVEAIIQNRRQKSVNLEKFEFLSSNFFQDQLWIRKICEEKINLLMEIVKSLS
jgi:hypothetical protein